MQTAAVESPKRIIPLPPPEYGERIRQLREAAGLTQEQVAVAVGDLRASIANQERAQRSPYEDDDRVRALAQVLGGDGEELVTLARQCRPTYYLPGSNVPQAHRDLARMLEQHWGQLPDDALAAAAQLAEEAPAHRGPPVTAPSAFGAWLQDQRLRAQPQLSQFDIGKRLGVTRSYVAMVELGSKGVSWPTEAIAKAAELFGAKLADVEALMARSRQVYTLPGRGASIVHRALAAVLAQRWRELPEPAVAEILTALMPADAAMKGRRRRW